RAAIALPGIHTAPGTRVPVWFPGRLGRLPLGVELLGRFERAVGLAFADEPVGGLAIQVVTLRLVEGALVVLEPEPLHRGEDLRRELLPRALDVGVLDPEEELALLAARVEKVVERRARTADMERACRRRRETDAGGVGGSVQRRRS